VSSTALDRASVKPGCGVGQAMAVRVELSLGQPSASEAQIGPQ
jgi:hypothetical protein